MHALSSPLLSSPLPQLAQVEILIPSVDVLMIMFCYFLERSSAKQIRRYSIRGRYEEFIVGVCNRITNDTNESQEDKARGSSSLSIVSIVEGL